MATTANSSSWVRTYTKKEATKYQIAYRSNNTWRNDANGKAVPGSFTTNLQVDRTAIDGGVTGVEQEQRGQPQQQEGLVRVEYGKENIWMMKIQH